MGRLAPLLLAAALFAPPKTLADSQTSFALELPSVEGATFCMVAPSEAADTSAECTSLERGSAYGGKFGERLIGAGALRYPDHELWIIASVTDKKGIGEISEESIDAIGRDVSKSFQSRGFGLISAPSAVGEVVNIGGARGVRYIVDCIGGAGPMRFVTYFFFQQDRAHTVIFFGPLAQAAEIRQVAERTIATLRVPPGELRMFGKPRWQRTAQWIAVRLSPFVALGLLVIPALWLWDRRRRAGR